MKSKDAEFNKIKTKVIRVLKKYKIKKAGIFGSYARGEQKKKSDIDILIQPTKHMGLEFAGLQIELEEKLKKKVDLLTYKSIHPYLKEYILRDEVRLL
ncbi:nucleotidyltransferase family protein [Candidatus Woesearchaeota archaeon]|nr:nucleotidyltransferase family protein [Candidatus Woesearchaeota archaeon]